MQKAISICELAANSSLVVVTNAGRIYQYKQSAQSGVPGTWTEIPLPEDFDIHDIQLTEKINVSGRLHKGYGLYKRNDNGLFYWEREEDQTQSEQFERIEGAIASARQDYMVRHPPKPQQPLPEVVR
jgi:hypothetical protein